jgi:hypothetical protein
VETTSLGGPIGNALIAIEAIAVPWLPPTPITPANCPARCCSVSSRPAPSPIVRIAKSRRLAARSSATLAPPASAISSAVTLASSAGASPRPTSKTVASQPRSSIRRCK